VNGRATGPLREVVACRSEQVERRQRHQQANGLKMVWHLQLACGHATSRESPTGSRVGPERVRCIDCRHMLQDPQPPPSPEGSHA
jgi:hypothetical protein